MMKKLKSGHPHKANLAISFKGITLRNETPKIAVICSLNRVGRKDPLGYPFRLNEVEFLI